jgi:hypothetical protein
MRGQVLPVFAADGRPEVRRFEGGAATGVLCGTGGHLPARPPGCGETGSSGTDRYTLRCDKCGLLCCGCQWRKTGAPSASRRSRPGGHRLPLPDGASWGCWGLIARHLTVFVAAGAAPPAPTLPRPAPPLHHKNGRGRRARANLHGHRGPRQPRDAGTLLPQQNAGQARSGGGSGASEGAEGRRGACGSVKSMRSHGCLHERSNVHMVDGVLLASTDYGQECGSRSTVRHSHRSKLPCRFRQPTTQRQPAIVWARGYCWAGSG